MIRESGHSGKGLGTERREHDIHETMSDSIVKHNAKRKKVPALEAIGWVGGKGKLTPDTGEWVGVGTFVYLNPIRNNFLTL